MDTWNITTHRLIARPCWYQLIPAPRPATPEDVPVLALRMKSGDADTVAADVLQITRLGLVPHAGDSVGVFARSDEDVLGHLFSWSELDARLNRFERWTDHVLEQGGEMEIVVAVSAGEADLSIVARRRVTLGRYPHLSAFAEEGLDDWRRAA